MTISQCIAQQKKVRSSLNFLLQEQHSCSKYDHIHSYQYFDQLSPLLQGTNYLLVSERQRQLK